ncbi:ANTAR domain-containing response regulator [Sulfuricaulis sp.]|jgi:response regulator NasT|uniref:ANTAR domain-containing response regulator n=1 Tax=Sulfuricaulis sp. TaxID=2003553 RepID=UPI00355A87B4
MSLSVLLVDDDPTRAAIVELALREAGYEVVTVVNTSTEMLTQVRAMRPDVIIIDRDSPDRDTLEHVCMITRDDPRPIVMFTQDKDRTLMREALEAGVSAYVVDGLSVERVRPIVEVALVRFEQWQALRRELDQAQTNLAERKVIERAKGIVMKQRRCTEDEAYALLRKLAMDRNQRLAHVAESVITMAELLT